MKVLVEQQAMTYLDDLSQQKKEHDGNTAGLFFSKLENSWVAFNKHLDVFYVESPTEALEKITWTCKN